MWEFGRVPEKQNSIKETIHVHSDSSSSYLHSATYPHTAVQDVLKNAAFAVSFSNSDVCFMYFP